MTVPPSRANVTYEIEHCNATNGTLCELHATAKVESAMLVDDRRNLG